LDKHDERGGVVTAELFKVAITSSADKVASEYQHTRSA
jgi:hypothetical protein